jgi:hypothetical protein
VQEAEHQRLGTGFPCRVPGGHKERRVEVAGRAACTYSVACHMPLHSSSSGRSRRGDNSGFSTMLDIAQILQFLGLDWENFGDVGRLEEWEVEDVSNVRVRKSLAVHGFLENSSFSETLQDWVVVWGS